MIETRAGAGAGGLRAEAVDPQTEGRPHSPGAYSAGRIGGGNPSPVPHACPASSSSPPRPPACPLLCACVPLPSPCPAARCPQQPVSLSSPSLWRLPVCALELVRPRCWGGWDKHSAGGHGGDALPDPALMGHCAQRGHGQHHQISEGEGGEESAPCAAFGPRFQSASRSTHRASPAPATRPPSPLLLLSGCSNGGENIGVYSASVRVKASAGSAYEPGYKSKANNCVVPSQRAQPSLALGRKNLLLRTAKGCSGNTVNWEAAGTETLSPCQQGPAQLRPLRSLEENIAAAGPCATRASGALNPRW